MMNKPNTHTHTHKKKNLNKAFIQKQENIRGTTDTTKEMEERLSSRKKNENRGKRYKIRMEKGDQ